MLSRLLIDKKSFYMTLSILLLISSILSFNAFDYKHSKDASFYKEKTQESSLMILTTIGKEVNLDKSFIKNVLK